MAVTENTYTGNGSTTNYSFTFPYLKTSDVKVTNAGTDQTVTTHFTFANATTVQFNTAPANGAAIRIYRETADTDLSATFYAGSAIKSQDLNDNFTQNLYVTQEVRDNSDLALSNSRSHDGDGTYTTAISKATSAESTANTASTNASSAVTTANTANATANTASTNASNAVTTANTASTNATTALNNSRESDGSGGFNTAIDIANTAKTTADSASSTATTASTNASSAVTTANTASTNASSAVSTANTASTNATNAVNTANTASTNATTALNNSRESDGSGGFNTAISIANTAKTTADTASSNATTAVSTANTASTNASNAVTTANSANATATAAQNAVADAVLYTPVTAVANIPGSPSNDDYVEVADSTGIESFTPLAGLPSGFTGDSGLTVKLRYTSSGTTWNYQSYHANDSEDRYLGVYGKHNTTQVSYTVKVVTKTAAHRYHGTGSGSGYTIGGIESPFLTLIPGNTYRFDQSHSSNSGHQIAFYINADKSGPWTIGVTANGTPGQTGAYTDLVVSDTTPGSLSYQCTSHAYMGNGMTTNTGAGGAGATGGGNDQIFSENDQVMTTSYSISANKNASCVGPVSINSGVVLTIPSTSKLLVLN